MPRTYRPYRTLQSQFGIMNAKLPSVLIESSLIRQMAEPATHHSEVLSHSAYFGWPNCSQYLCCKIQPQSETSYVSNTHLSTSDFEFLQQESKITFSASHQYGSLDAPSSFHPRLHHNVTSLKHFWFLKL